MILGAAIEERLALHRRYEAWRRRRPWRWLPGALRRAAFHHVVRRTAR